MRALNILIFDQLVTVNRIWASGPTVGLGERQGKAGDVVAEGALHEAAKRSSRKRDIIQLKLEVL